MQNKTFIFILYIHSFRSSSDDLIYITKSWFPGIVWVYCGLSSWTLLKLSVAFLPPWSIVAIDIATLMEPLPSYQQLLIVDFPRIWAMWPLPGNGQAGTCIFSQIFRPFGQNATFLPAYTLPYTYTIRWEREVKLYHSWEDSYAGTYTHINIHTFTFI
jgi:hypothetical protein